MKFGRVRFRVKKLVISDPNAVQKDGEKSPANGQGAASSSARNSHRLNIDNFHDNRISDMSIGQDT